MKKIKLLAMKLLKKCLVKTVFESMKVKINIPDIDILTDRLIASLRITYIYVLLVQDYRYCLKCKYLKKQRHFAHFLSDFLLLH